MKRQNYRNKERKTGSKLSDEVPAADHQVHMKEITERVEIIEVTMAVERELLRSEEIGKPRNLRGMNQLGILEGEVKKDMI